MNLPLHRLNDEILSNADLARLYLILVTSALNSGTVVIKQRQFAQQINLSYQQLRTLLSKLQHAQLITQSSTHTLTQITICMSESKRKRSTQSSTHTPTRQNTHRCPDNNPILELLSNTPRQPDFDSFMEFFNSNVSPTAIPPIRRLDPQRRRLLQSCADEYGLATLGQALRLAVDSDFLSGRSGKWHASFDWIFKKENFKKILEGNYANQSAQCSDGNYAVIKNAAAAVLRHDFNSQPLSHDKSPDPFSMGN